MINFKMKPLGGKAMKTDIVLLVESQAKPKKPGIMAVNVVTNHNPFHPRGIFLV